MGREVKRVSLDFDWPIGAIWPPYMASICTEEMGYCIGKDKTTEERCIACRHAGKLAKRPWKKYFDCPEWATQPPTGEGYQLWETTSEGSPISPVFKTPEELAQWLFDIKASAFGSCTATYEHWLNFIKGPGWAPSAIMSKGTIRSGVEAFSDNEDNNRIVHAEIEGGKEMDREGMQTATKENIRR